MRLSNSGGGSGVVSRCGPAGPARAQKIAYWATRDQLSAEAAQHRVAEIDAERQHVAAEAGDLDILGQSIEAHVVAARVDPRRDLAHRGAEPDAVEPRPQHGVLQRHGELAD